MEQKPSVLIVDDDEFLLKAIKRSLAKENIDVMVVQSPEEALDVLSSTPIRVVVSDMKMPGMSGLEFLAMVRERWPCIIRLMLTADDRVMTASQAVNRDEVYRFLTKPFNIEELSEAISQALSYSYLEEEKERLVRTVEEQNRLLLEANGHLEKTVAERTKELRSSYLAIVIALSEAVEAKDPYTRGHSERVASMASEIARAIRFDERRVEEIHLAGLLHDVGKIGIPEKILQKPGPLTQEEIMTMRLHPGIGIKIVRPVLYSSDIIAMIQQHHEWFGGGGYPQGLKGEEIVIGARILQVADTVDAMGSERPYRKPFMPERIMEELVRFSGIQFDPKIVAVVDVIYRENGNSIFKKGDTHDKV